MIIAINTRLLRKDKLDGIGWFTYNCLKYIIQKNPKIQFHLFFDHPPDDSFSFGSNVIRHIIWPPAKHALLNIIWFELGVRRKLNRLKPDLFLSPDGILCLGWKGDQLAVIHDINFLHQPKYLKPTNRIYYNYFFPRFGRLASRIATVSEFSKKDIMKHYHIESDKIDVVYNGINAFYTPTADHEKQNIRLKYTAGKKYFIFIGTISPRKNIDQLMIAFDRFKTNHPCDLQLLIVGRNMYKTEELFACQAALKYGSDIHFLGRKPDAELNSLLAAAEALVFIPVFEGFGIPVIEAMQCQVPVIASNVTSVPEVVGDAALLVDPYNVEAIAEAMQAIATQPSLRSELIARGNIRKMNFSWEKTADLLWQSVEKALNTPKIDR